MSRKSLLADALVQTLELKTVLFVEDENPKYAYFPTSGVASVVALTTTGQTSEVGFTGCEGVVGAYHLLGPAKVSLRCFVQIEGDFIRVPFVSLRTAYAESKDVHARILEFIQADCITVSQMAGCNQMHETRQRLARWLLMADDRHGAKTLGVTHEILAEMVAASRSTVTVLSGVMKRRGLISYTRGTLKIVNRPRLEEMACDCYGIAKQLFNDLYVSRESVERS